MKEVTAPAINNTYLDLNNKCSGMGVGARGHLYSKVVIQSFSNLDVALATTCKKAMKKSCNGARGAIRHQVNIG